MDVYDTNVWIFGLTTTDSRASELVSQVTAGDRSVVVNAYIYQEVVQNLQAGADSDTADLVINAFADIVNDSPNVEGPTTSAVSDIDIDDVRTSTQTCLIGHSLGCQSKDVPIVVAAYRRAQQRQEHPTIYTNDGKSDEKKDGLLNLDFSEYESGIDGSGALGDGGYNPTTENPLGVIQTEFVPEPN